MKTENIKLKDISWDDLQKENYFISDWKDTDALLENFDSMLSEYGLELVVGDAGDDSNWIKIEKKENTDDKNIAD